MPEAASPSLSPSAAVPPPVRVMYVGTYTGSGAEGIYTFRVDAATGVPAPLAVTAAANPSYLAVSGGFVYAAIEDSGAGSVGAYRIGDAGTLTPLNTVPAGGSGTTHVSVHPAGFVAAANYGSGTFPVFRLLPDGRIGARTAMFTSTGRGPVSGRQNGPHAHQIVAAGELLYAVDLGADKVNVLRLDTSTGAVTPDAPITLPPGSGPRHLAPHPTLAVLYVLNELSSTVAVVRSGQVTDTLSTLPPGTRGRNFPAEIRVHPGGRFAYATNRGHDSVAVFTVDGAGGLASAGAVAVGGKAPRGMNLDPDGRFLYTANQDSDSISVFSVDQASGALTAVTRIDTPTPVDIQFGPAPGS